MFGRLFRRDDDIQTSLYGAIATQSRTPILYTDFAVPDTIEGRFEMVVLHLAIVLRRLGAAGDEASEIGQGIFDIFCREMDRSLREMGVGDLSVPKKMRKIGEAYYGRAAAYDEALRSRDGATLAVALTRNVYGGRGGEPAIGLAAYALAADTAVRDRPMRDFVAGRIAFPDPADHRLADGAAS